ncbi:hypothetical protein, partial [Pseudomonas sp. AB6]
MQKKVCVTLMTVAATILSMSVVHAADVDCNVGYRTVSFEYKGPAKDAQQLAGDLASKAVSMSGSEPKALLDAAFGKGGYEIQARDMMVFVPNGAANIHGDLNEASKAVVSADGKSTVVRYRSGWKFIYSGLAGNGINTEVTVQQFAETPLGTKPAGSTATAV